MSDNATLVSAEAADLDVFEGHRIFAFCALGRDRVQIARTLAAVVQAARLGTLITFDNVTHTSDNAGQQPGILMYGKYDPNGPATESEELPPALATWAVAVNAVVDIITSFQAVGSLMYGHADFDLTMKMMDQNKVVTPNSAMYHHQIKQAPYRDALELRGVE